MRLVVALGGNALGNTPEEQKQIVTGTASALSKIVELGNELIVTHGNGPQVGMIDLAFDASSREGATPKMPFPECNAMSQAYIGYHLQKSIYEQLRIRGIEKQVVTLVTQVLIDKNDPAFENPTKPIGGYYTAAEAEVLEKEKGYIMKDMGERGYRRIVASPMPVDIVERDSVKALIASGAVVITVGGGGIPVYRNGNHLQGVSAVIDKDYASEKVAELTDADAFIILTAVDKVSINFGKEDQVDFDTMTVSQAEQFIKEGQFGKGSMLPKVQAAMRFVKKSGKPAIIAGLSHAAEAIEGLSGTRILPD